ncbi:Uncharacterized conserved protein [Ceraceosorus bombacis]|uniref:methylated diphthine methylhydrolase n=1 Tax=Ceraceosorus bombacis TaxID=401625 RepID=A0A0P1BLV3_9BASI|nr:Uncharacterized conserved protein [Ceraceosorus bombacis]
MKIELSPARSLFTASTGLCADSIAAYPYDTRGAETSADWPELFALGTYEVEQCDSSAKQSASPLADGGESDDEEQQPSSSSPEYTRRGRILLYRTQTSSAICEESATDEDCRIGVQLAYTSEDAAAILDMCWLPLPALYPSSQRPEREMAPLCLLSARANSSLSLHSLRSKSSLPSPGTSRGCSYSLQQEATVPLSTTTSGVLALSIDQSAKHVAASDFGQVDSSVVVSQSDGTLALIPSLDFTIHDSAVHETTFRASIGKASSGSRILAHDETAGLEDESDEEEEEEEEGEKPVSLQKASCTARHPSIQVWRAHDHEAWIAAFDRWSEGNVCWSGGDDLTLKGWDLRTPCRSGRRESTFACRRFEGGVTAMQSSHLRQHLWAVGSYDGQLRLFDARQPQRPFEQVDMGGGIWRTKWHPTDPNRLLIGAMHAGFRIVALSPPSTKLASETMWKDASLSPEIHTTFEEHQSLAYGCDWISQSKFDRKADNLVASCSFYDRRLHVWRAS